MRIERYGTVSYDPTACNTAPYRIRDIAISLRNSFRCRRTPRTGNLVTGICFLPAPLFAVVPQALQLEDGDAAIFKSQEAFLFQPVQTLVGILPGDARQRSDFLLGDVEMKCRVRIEDRIEQRGNAAGNTRCRVQRSAIVDQRGKLPEAFVELANQEAIETYTTLEQPDEGGTVHHCHTRVAQCHHVVTSRLVLEHRTFAEPCTGGQTCEARRLAATGHDAHPCQAAH